MGESIEFTSDEALVLLDFALRFTETDKITIEHHAEEIALWNLGCLREKQSNEIVEMSYQQPAIAVRDVLAGNLM